MTSIADAPSVATSRASRPKRQRFWLVDFFLSPFADTDERADYKTRTRRPERNRGAPPPFRNAAPVVAGVVAGQLPGRPTIKRFPRGEE